MTLAQPLFGLYWLWRGLKQKAYWQHLPERFGYVAPCQVDYWVHAVSVGETQAAVPLIKALAKTKPEAKFLLTSATPTGRATACELLKASGIDFTQRYLPMDAPAAVARFFKRVTPSMGIIMETEWWPSLLAAAPCPMVLVNGRLSEKSAHGYRRYPKLTEDTLAHFQLILAQDASSAARMEGLGAQQVRVSGNLKFDCDAKVDTRLSEVLPTRYILAASTREGEEALILAAYQHLQLTTPLVIVPRHPERFGKVADLAKNMGFTVAIRSSDDCRAAQVIIGDSMGEMMAYYHSANAVLMGGSYLPFGAHNFIEPCALGRRVILGPSTFNFAQAAASALAHGAVAQVESVAAAFALIEKNVLPDPSQASAWALANQGATAMTLAALQALAS